VFFNRSILPFPYQATEVIRDGPSKKIKQAPVFLDLGTNLGYNAIKMGIHAAKCKGHVYAPSQHT
jgi:hypothetical protein